MERECHHNDSLADGWRDLHAPDQLEGAGLLLVLEGAQPEVIRAI